MSSSGGTGVDPEFCSSAREFAVERLEEVEGTMSPAELASEYSCTNVHMRGVLGDLVGEGEVERVGRGLYTSPSEETDEAAAETSDSLTGEDTESGDSSMPTEDEYQRQQEAIEAGESKDEMADPPEGESGDSAAEERNLSEEIGDAFDGSEGGSSGALLFLAGILFIVIVVLQATGGEADETPDASGRSQEQEEQSEEVPLIEQ